MDLLCTRWLWQAEQAELDGAQPFPLERLLSIFIALLSYYHEEGPAYALTTGDTGLYLQVSALTMAVEILHILLLLHFHHHHHYHQLCATCC